MSSRSVAMAETSSKTRNPEENRQKDTRDALEMAGAGEALRFIFLPRFGELDGAAVRLTKGRKAMTEEKQRGSRIEHGTDTGARPRRRGSFAKPSDTRAGKW